MLKLFSGTSNSNLSQEVSELLKVSLSKVEIIRFANSEVRVRILDNVKNQICVFIQSTSNPTDTNLMELFFFCDAAKREEAKKVIGIIPYFGYARQNIQHRVGECVSANVVIRFLETIGFHKIYTINLHDEATEGIFSIPYKNLSTLPILAKTVKKYLFSTISTNSQQFINKISIISPDQGGIERARKFAQSFFPNREISIALIEKKRNLEKIHQSEALALYGDVEGKIAILIDDIITSGRTLINAAQLCFKYGAKKVIAAVVHHDFSPDFFKLFNSPSCLIEKIFTTNTIALPPEKKFEKLKEISVASLIAEELKILITNNK